MRSIVLSKAHNGPSLNNERRSPFAIYANEQITKLESDATPTFKMTDNELDLLIISAVHKLKVATSMLLEKMLRHMGADEEVNQKVIQKRLKLLSASEFLTAYIFEVSNGNYSKSSNNVYTLGWRGAGLLRAKGHTVSYLKELSSPEFAKQMLSAMQYVVNSKVSVDNFEMFTPLFVPTKKGKKIFYPRAIIRDDAETIFVEPIRRSDSWKRGLIDKLKKISSIIQSKEHNVQFSRGEASLLLIAENTAHMKEIMELVNSHCIFYPVKIFYSCDTLIYMQPENCVYSLKPGFLASLFSA